MKKLSNITESIWSDIQDRSSGITVRKEDNVNNMDMESFWLYIIKNYKERVKILDKDHYCKDYDMDIVVDPSTDIVIFGSYVKDELVRIMVVLKTKAKDTTVKKIIDTSPDNFRWIRINSDKLELALNDGEVTNQTFVDLIEFFLNNQQVFESIWSDLQDRSSGEIERKEDAFISNIKNMKPVDLGSDVPVYFADIDLEVNDENEFTWEEVLNFLPKIEKTGWKLLCGPKGVQNIFYNGKKPPTFNNDDDNYEKQWIQGKEGILRSKETKEELHFYTDNKYGSINYWCVDDRYEPGNLNTASCKRIPGKTKYITQRGFEVFLGSVITTNNFMVNSKCRIRLVKDK